MAAGALETTPTETPNAPLGAYSDEVFEIDPANPQNGRPDLSGVSTSLTDPSPDALSPPDVPPGVLYPSTDLSDVSPGVLSPSTDLSDLPDVPSNPFSPNPPPTLSRNPSDPADYAKLVDYAGFASFAYCLKRGLEAGLVGSQAGCPLQMCSADPYLKVEILHTFNLNVQGEVGAGYYAIDHSQKRIILAFRGTASTIDWAGNLNAFLVNYEPIVYATGMGDIDCPGCKVHKGFYNFVKNNCADVIRRVAEIKEDHPDYQLVVVGHSLGGALTVLTGIELQLLGHSPLVISYASPRVGNKALAAFIDKIGDTDALTAQIMENKDFTNGFLRVTHAGDLVPKLPPKPIYQHAGFEYHINKRELPHPPLSLDRLDHSVGTAALIKLPSLSKLWPDFFGKNEHKNYFMRVPGCNEAKETLSEKRDGWWRWIL